MIIHYNCSFLLYSFLHEMIFILVRNALRKVPYIQRVLFLLVKKDTSCFRGSVFFYSVALMRIFSTSVCHSTI